MTLVQTYLQQQEYYESLYGSKTVVLLMKGSFYEAYSTHTVGQAHSVAKLLNIVLTKENKSIETVSDKNPYMTGFPVGAFGKYIKVFMQEQYTVITLDQDPNNVSDRSKSRVYSPGTYFDESTPDSAQYACVVYAEYDENFEFGIAAIDLSTGACSTHEITAGLSSARLEDLFRIVESYDPKEIELLHSGCKSDHIERITQCTRGGGCRVHHLKECDPQYSNIEYQNVLLQKVYSTQSVLSPIESLNLEMFHSARIALIGLFQFCYERDSTALSGIQHPTCNHDASQLVLHNNTMYQLGVLTNSKDPSLFDVVNHTSTPLGKRRLRLQLVRPTCNPDALNELYSATEHMASRIDFYETHLKCIADIERFHRKMHHGTLHPYELATLSNSLDHVLELMQEHDGTSSTEFQRYTDELQKTFCIPLCTMSLSDIACSLFANCENEELENTSKAIESCQKSLDGICAKLSKHVPKQPTCVKVEGNYRMGFCVATTAHRGLVIKNALGPTGGYSFKNDKKRCIIYNNSIDTLTHRLASCQEKIRPIALNAYVSALKHMHGTHSNAIHQCHEFVAHVDTIKSRAVCVRDYGFSKPTLKRGDSSYVQVKKLKHPIIDHLQTQNNTGFIPNDVQLDDESRGILLYGVNGAGKSCYAKSVGLAVVLAQSGHFVPAEEFTLCPFTSMYTRISDQDNIYKGHSSFFVEMNELKSIIHCSNNRSIVIGDEVCKGTEDVSALALVAASLRWLIDRGTKFIFASHLHRLPELSVLKDESRLAIKHMAVQCNESDNLITFTRQLKDGIGNTLYGLEIANFVIRNDHFASLARECRNEVVKKKTKLVSTKRSKYNGALIVDKCQIPECGSRESLDTHHIVYQSKKTAGVQMHGVGNLVVLCKTHHNLVHSGKLCIHGWTSTTSGKALSYEFVENA